jgi:hypothetical protein
MQTQPTPSTSTQPLDPKKIFEVHLDALKDAYKELIDANQKIAGVLLIVLGWFTGKDNPLVMLCYSKYFVYIALIFTGFGFVALHHLFKLVFLRGIEATKALQANGYTQDLYGRYRVTKSMLWSGLFGQFTMLAGILAAIFYKYDFLWQKTCRL